MDNSVFVYEITCIQLSVMITFQLKVHLRLFVTVIFTNF